ncbi:hypothetical protein BCR35DRAFT_303297 [Leucosporidium creatinivorum]|uniref:Uncharacterized protein n=1 Tax=Leucosporidium creatinivorum TaxID=106004 RepID=A0A1Y2FLV8_9BASI|nr:hypothetical protein BCR35DRAFT_311457 [Leucosporidium creatinivorum]ORY84196.1 hypothetical protein BCR35DRAFT_303297 [Leucosporidium creatinivorum]
MEHITPYLRKKPANMSTLDYARASTPLMQSSIRGACKVVQYPGHVTGPGHLVLRSFALTTPAEQMYLNFEGSCRRQYMIIPPHFELLLAHQVYVYYLVFYADSEEISGLDLFTSTSPSAQWARFAVQSFEEHLARSKHIGVFGVVTEMMAEMMQPLREMLGMY